MARIKRQLETPSGSYSAIPHAVLDSVAFTGSSYPAKALLLELVRQLNGRNNGHLQLTSKWLKTRGWKSDDVIHRAKDEMLERQLIMQTRQGGLNHGASQYLVTWLTVSSFVGLDITAKDYHPGAWQFMDKPPQVKNASPAPSDRGVKTPAPPSGSGRRVLFPVPAAPGDRSSKNASSAPSNGYVKDVSAPPHGVAAASTAPGGGARRGLFLTSAAPPDGDNVVHQYPTGNSSRLAAGKPAKSGNSETAAFGSTS